MIKILPIDESEYDAAFELMRENMEIYHEAHKIPWDQDWVNSNYRNKENYSVFRRCEWIGFLSIEWLVDAAFIHTLQLAKSVQGGIFGIRVFEWILAQAEEREIFNIACKSFRDNPALELYRKLGFEVAAEEGVLLELHLSFNKALKNAPYRRGTSGSTGRPLEQRY